MHCTEMKIRGWMLDPGTNMPIVILKDVDSEMIMPIWVGIFEANAILAEVEKNPAPRPMTHDLLKNMIQNFGYVLDFVEISDLVDSTFYARLVMNQEGNLVLMDARPSDALALAMRLDCPIYVADHVLEAAKVNPNQAAEKLTGDQARAWLEKLGDDDLGRYKM